MKEKQLALLLFLIMAGVVYYSTVGVESTSPANGIPSFEKIMLDSVFRSESVTTADINKDGELDIVIGDVWYEAPEWKVHEIRPPGDFLSSVFREDKPTSEYSYYSNSFACQVLDVDEDGWQDVLVYPVMGQPVYWYKNPQGKAGHWEEYKAVEDYHGESPMLVDLRRNGKKGLCVGSKMGKKGIIR